jgi:glutamate synthase (NADPH/NADH) small chain
MDVDLVVVSVGVSPNPLIPNSHPDLGVRSKGTLEATDALQTTVGDVWAGGDIVRGGATVILAMGDGRKAAASMHAKFQGK